jgi:hypothetical protein
MDNVTPVGELSDADWERLQDLANRFESTWQETKAPNATVDVRDFLPPSEDSLRLLALQELVKTDLEMRCRRGFAVQLEWYLQHYPELGTCDSLATDLVYEEYRVRQRYGDRPALESYQQRFPQQFGDLQKLVQAQPIPAYKPSPRHSPASRHEAPPKANVNSEHMLHMGGEYRPLKKLGKGSFGEIWRAEAPGGVEVAIKIIYGSIAREESRREREALELIKHLRHVYLLPVHAFWQMEDRLLIAMELADGSLRDRFEQCRQKGDRCLPLVELLGYFREAAEALDYLHGKHVLHRDIKPENILLLEGHAKLADFGMARVLEEGQRMVSSSGCGTPAYTAPEVFWKGQVGAWSDQYSLAAAYVELRLGRPLFPTKNWYNLMHDHLQRSPDLVPLLEPEQRVLRQALAKEPEQRFRNCQEFMRELLKAVPREE